MSEPFSYRLSPGRAALLAGLIPFIAIHVSYLLAAGEGYVDWCLPYIDSCTSISATGRQGIAYVWFKVTMIPSACILFGFWWQSPKWLGAGALHVRWIGCVGSVCLALYTVALGEAGDLFRLQRRIGATLYFTLTYLAQLFVAARLIRQMVVERHAGPVKAMMGLCVMALVIGLYSIALDVLTDWQDEVEDAIEWQLALIIDSWFIACYWYLRRTKPGQSVKPRTTD